MVLKKKIPVLARAGYLAETEPIFRAVWTCFPHTGPNTPQPWLTSKKKEKGVIGFFFTKGVPTSNIITSSEGSLSTVSVRKQLAVRCFATFPLLDKSDR